MVNAEDSNRMKVIFYHHGAQVQILLLSVSPNFDIFLCGRMAEWLTRKSIILNTQFLYQEIQYQKNIIVHP